ncbi:MAG: Amuc_1100 family pilus-like protein [Verrucomicrobiales bacterium]
MNWFQENKALSAFLVIILLAAAALGYLVFQKYQSYATAADLYDTAEREYMRLVGLPLYPKIENLELLRQQQAEYKEAIAELQQALAQQNLATEAITAGQFQISLRQKAEEIVSMAAESGLSLPEDFFLGFSAYRDTPPASDDVASALWHQLRVADLVLRVLIAEGVSELTLFEREPVLGERGQVPGEAEAPLISSYRIHVAFVGEQSRQRRVVNSLVALDQLIILRSLVVENVEKTAPSREAPASAQPAAATINDIFAGAEPAAASAPEERQRLQLLVGQEPVQMTLALEILQVLDPSSVLKEENE